MNSLPRLSIAHLPTPVEELPRLAAALHAPRLLMKRDDLTGLALGGNKTRKLEFLVAEAQANGARTLVSAGAVQSNHCRQTAAAAAKFGMACTLVLTGEAPPQATANLLLDYLFGAQVIFVPNRADRDQTLAETFAREEAAGKAPYLVPYGGSSPTGALAYAFALQELIQQGYAPDWIVFGTSSGGTQAGFVLGQRLFGFGGKIIGLSIDEPQAHLQAQVAALASLAAQKMGEDFTFSPQDVLVTDAYCGAGYGVLTDLEREAVRLFARHEGILLDPVYTGRAAGGMIDLLRQGFFRPEETLLFWNTGGQPALFSEKYQPFLLASNTAV